LALFLTWRLFCVGYVICGTAEGYVICRAGGGMLSVEFADVVVVGCGVMVGQIVCQRWSLTGLTNLCWKRRRIRWRVLLMIGVPLNGVVDFSRC
jgi:hypothetical protein